MKPKALSQFEAMPFCNNIKTPYKRDKPRCVKRDTSGQLQKIEVRLGETNLREGVMYLQLQSFDCITIIQYHYTSVVNKL